LEEEEKISEGSVNSLEEMLNQTLAVTLEFLTCSKKIKWRQVWKH
jgi:hypothetical protein